MSARIESTSRRFEQAVKAMMGVAWRPEMVVEEIPAPQRIAPFAVAISAEVLLADEELGSGRLVLLHDPEGNPAWEGDFRCVSYVRAGVDSEMAIDPLLNEVGWSWLEDALSRQQAVFAAPSGTVTAVSSRSFGTMETEPPRAEVEIRASWTPLLESADDVTRHLLAWSDLLCTTAGLPPLPQGVIPLSSRLQGGRRW